MKKYDSRRQNVLSLGSVQAEGLHGTKYLKTDTAKGEKVANLPRNSQTILLA